MTFLKENLRVVRALLVLILLAFIFQGCNPNPGIGGASKTSTGGGGTDQRPPPQSIIDGIHINAQERELQITGRNLGHISKIRITGPSSFDHTFSITGKNDNGITAIATSAITFILNGAYNLVFTNALGAGAFAFTITIADGTVTATKLAQSGATDGQVLKWDNSSSTWVAADDVGAGAGGGTVTQVTLGTGVVSDGSNITTIGSVVVDTDTTGHASLTKIPFFSLDANQVESRNSLEIGSAAQLLFSESATSDFLIYNDDSLKIKHVGGSDLLIVESSGDVTTAGNLVISGTLTGASNVCLSSGTNCSPASSVADNSITSTKILDDTIVDGDISSSAAISPVKIATGIIDQTEFNYLDNLSTTVGGKLSNVLTDTQIFVGNGSNVATGVAASGDVTMANTGAVTIANDAITTVKIIDDAITTAKIVDDAVTSAKIVDNAVTSAKIINDTIVDADINSSAAIDATKIADGTVTSAEFQYINSLSSNAQTQIDNQVLAAGDTMTGDLVLNTLVKLKDGDSAELVTIQASTSTGADYTLTLPIDDGTSGQALTTNGSGVLSWDESSGPPTGAAGGGLTGTYPNPTIATSAVNTVNILDGAVDTNKILDATIATADMANDSISLAKMAGLTSANFILGNASGDPAAVTMSGDATMDNAGAVTIANDAVSLAKMAGLTSANFILGDGSGNPAAVTMSGDATMANTGALTIANDAVTMVKLQNVTQGSIIIGGGSNVPTVTDANDDGKILIGDATDLNSVAVSGDIGITNAGVTSISSGVIVDADINASAGIDATKIADGSVTDTEFQYINALTSDAQVNIDSRVLDTGDTMTGDLTLDTQLLLKDGDSANYVTVKASNSVSDYTLTLPDDAGTTGYVLTTNGSGVTSWVDPTSTGDITGVIAGDGLINGGLSGNVTLDVNPDDVTIETSGDALRLKDDGVTLAKMAGLTSANFILGDGSGDPAAVTMSGDATMANTGAVTIANDAVETVMIANDQVTMAKLQNVTQGSIIIGGASNAPTVTDASGDGKILIGDATDLNSVAVSGDIGITNAGVTSISTGVIVNADVNASAAIDATKMADGSVTSTEFQYINTLGSNAQTQIDNQVLASGDTMTGTLAMGSNNITGTGTISAGSFSSSAQSGVALSPHGTSAGNTGEARFLELAAGGSEYVGFKGPDSVGTSLLYTLPSSAPGTSGDVLSSTTGGVMSWISALTTTVSDGTILVGNGSNVAVERTMSGDITMTNAGVTSIGTGKVTSDDILDATIATGDVANNAIDTTKLDDITQGSILIGGATDPVELDVKTSGQIVVGNGTTGVSVAVSGDATLASGGALTIASGAVSYSEIADFSGGAVIVGVDGADPTIADLGAIDASILVGNISGTAAAQSLSGDVTMTNAGVVSIGTGKVTSDGILDGEIVNADVSASAAIAATKIASSATGNIAATEVDAAIAELEAEKLALAGGTMSGAINMGSQDITSAGSVAATDLTTSAQAAITVGADATNAGEIRFKELTGNGTNYVGLQAPDDAGASDLVYTLPASAPGTSGDVLSSTTGGVMSWVSALTTTLSDGTILLGNGSNVATEITISGDVTMTNAGVASISSGVIVDADVNASANITATKLGTGVVDNTEFNYLNGVTSAIQTQVDAKLPLSGGTMTGAVTTSTQDALILSPFNTGAGNTGEARFLELAANGIHYVGMKAPDSVAANLIFVLPGADGSNTQALVTDGSGNLSWGGTAPIGSAGGDLSGTYPNPDIAADTIVNADINSSAAIVYSKLNIADADLSIAKTSGLQTALDAKVALAGGTMTGDLIIDTLMKFKDGDGTDNYITLKAPNALTSNLVFTLPSSLGTSNYILKTDGAGNLSWTAVTAALIADDDNDTQIRTQKFVDEDKLRFDTLGLERMIIDESGNVGIATSSPTDKLHVVGNIVVTGTVDGRDVASDGSAIDNLNTTIGLSALASGEVDQLENIASTTISATQWGYVGGADQALTTSDSPIFATGTMSTSLKLKDSDSANYVTLAASASVTDYTFTFPDTAGTNTYLLQTNGSGVTTWIDPASIGGVTSVFSRTGAVTAATSDYDAIQIDNTAAGNIAATNVQTALNELDTEKLALAGGTMSGALAMGTNNITGVDTFTSTGDATFDTNTLFVDVSANSVGIGTTTPNTLLQVKTASTTDQAAIATFTSGENRSMQILQGYGNSGAAPFTFSTNNAFNFNIDGVDVMTLAATGSNVGIGTTSPENSLHISKVAGVADFIGLQIENGSGLVNANVGIYLAAATSDPGVRLLAVAPGGSDNELQVSVTNNGVGVDALRIDDEGNVGIGTTSPLTRLHVAGGLTLLNHTASRTYLNQASATVTHDTASSSNMTVLVEGNFHAEGWVSMADNVTSSDRRIKKIIGKSNNERNLEIVKSIEITDYKFVDSHERGNDIHKKVIAQQIEEVYPVAVKHTKDFIPNIYRTAISHTSTDKSLIVFIKDHNLQKGDKVKLIIEEFVDEESITSRKIYGGVIDTESNSFEITTNEKLKENSKIFVYGKEVSDFRSVDYDALSMLGISAIQKQQEQIEKNQEMFAVMQGKWEDHERRIASLEEELEELRTENEELRSIKKEHDQMKTFLCASHSEASFCQ